MQDVLESYHSGYQEFALSNSVATGGRGEIGQRGDKW